MNHKTKISKLKKSEIFNQLSLQEISLILSYGKIIKYSSNKSIIKQGEEGKGIYVILSGKVNVYVKMPGQGKLPLGSIQTGGFFGEVSMMFENILSTATIKAVGIVECFYLDKNYYQALYYTNLDILKHINDSIIKTVLKREKIMCKKIRELMDNDSKNPGDAKISCEKRKVKVSRRALTKEELNFFKDFEHIDNFKEVLKLSSIVTINHAENITQQLTGYCYVITNGAVQVLINSKKRISTLAVYGPETIFFPITSVENEKEFFCYRTCGSAQILEIPITALTSIHHDHRLQNQVHDILAHYMVLIQKYMNTLMLRLSIEKYSYVNSKMKWESLNV